MLWDCVGSAVAYLCSNNNDWMADSVVHIMYVYSGVYVHVANEMNFRIARQKKNWGREEDERTEKEKKSLRKVARHF